MAKNVDVSVVRAVGVCKNCGSKRDIYYTSGFLYGTCLYNTEDGKGYAYINTFTDTAFDEVEIILKRILDKESPNNHNARYFKRIFGVACDPINGVKLNADSEKLACLNCGSDQLEHEDRPDEIMIVNLPQVTHEAWDKLNSDEKEKLIYDELKLKRCI